MIAMKAAAIGNQRPPNGLNPPSQSAAGFVVDPSSNPTNFPPLASSSNLPSSSSLPPPSNWLAQRQPKLNGQEIVAERGGGGHHQNRLGLPDLPAGLLSEEDLEGGKLTSVEEREEIDPEDGCKIQIWTYHILSADGMEESTITKRRKLKVNCTQSLKRVEFTNGKETKYEEKAVIDNLDSLGQQNSLMNGRRNCAVPLGQFSGTRPSIEFSGDGEENLTAQNDDESKEISHMLLQTQDNFLMLLREKKDALVKMFPELFSNLRTFPAIFNLIPSTVMETVVNEDGSTTTRTKCSKAFSSHYTRQETFINGIRKESKSRFRAFMEYAGPEGGFCIRLNDNPEADLSEDEGVGNELEDGSGGSTSSDGRSRISSSGRSELTDIQSALGTTGGKGQGGQLCLVEGKEAARRREKAWHAVNEMVESEERYVQKLGLLEKFRSEVERARVLDRRQMGQLFANIASLHQFHEQHLLPQLMDRRREWQSTRRISDVLRKQAPFLKMYSEYTNNYKSATQIYEECARRKRAFEEIVKRVEQLPECEHLSLVSHLICPVQRVMRYQLLLKEYQKYLTPNDADWQDTEMALSLVMDAASHANEMMRKLDRYRNVLEVQEHLGNILVLVSPGRELLTRSRLNKCSSSTGKVEERILFVFNDLFLLASERSTLIGGIGVAKYKLRAIFAAKHTQIYEGDNLELENSFYLRGADSPQGPQRCVELYCGSQAEKNALFDTVWAVIQEAHSHEAGAHSTAALKHAAADQQKKSCARCDTDFGWYTRQFACQRCGQRFCKRCIEQKPHRMCVDCHQTSEGIRSKSEGVAISQTRKNLLQISANNDDGIIKASFVTFRGPSAKQLQRFFVLRRDFCLYSYRNDMDRFALAMLPLSGCDIGVHQQEKFGITMKHLNRVYLLICANESDHAEWLAALLLSANAKLPGEQLAHPEGVDEDEMDGGGGIKKSATIGFSSGRQNSVQKKEAQKPKNSFASLNPLSSLIRRSASMGDQRIDQVEMAMARERVRELNAKNAAVANQKNKDQQQFQQMQRDCADENGTTFRF